MVLAAILLKVRGSDRYDDDEREGEGEGGELGGKGRTEASSSATLLGDQVEPRARDSPSEDLSSSNSDASRASLSPFKDIVLRLAPANESSRPCARLTWEGATADGSGEEVIRFVGRTGSGLLTPVSLFAFVVPPNFLWNQLINGLLLRRLTLVCWIFCLFILGFALGFGGDIGLAFAAAAAAVVIAEYKWLVVVAD